MSTLKKKIISVFSLAVVLTAFSVCIIAEDITATSVTPSVEPGWKGKVQVKFRGVFNVETSTITAVSQNPNLQISNPSVTNATLIPAQPPAEGETPPPAEHNVTVDMTVETTTNLSPGRVNFTLQDDTSNRVSGRIRVQRISNKFILASPNKVEPGTGIKVTLHSNSNISKDTIIHQEVSSSGCEIVSASIQPPSDLALTLDIDENLGGQKLNFFFTIGSSEEYRSFLAPRILTVIARSISINKVIPSTIKQGDENLTIKVRGENFRPRTKVIFPESSIKKKSSIFVSNNELEVVVDVDVTAKVGYTDVIVKDFNLEDIGKNILLIEPGAFPKIISVDPSELPAGAKRKMITVYGKNFDHNTKFFVQGRGITIHNVMIINSTRAQLLVSVEPRTSAGFRDLSVSTLKGFEDSKARALRIEIPLIKVTSIIPNYLEQDTTGNVLQIRGQNFQDGLKAEFKSPHIKIDDLNVISSENLRMSVSVDKDIKKNYATFSLANPNQTPVTVTGKIRIIKKQYDYKIALVSPGVSYLDIDSDELTEEELTSRLMVNTLYPMFQWNTNAESVDFSIYQPIPGQKDVAEIISNKPLYRRTGITSDHLTYPLEARELKRGIRYYWKVDAIFRDKTLSSEVWCFEIRENQ